MKGLTYLNLILIVYLLLITEYTLPSGSCQPSDETHRGCPRRAPGASRGTARENRGPWRAWEAGCPVRARAERTPTEPWEAGAWARGAQVLLRLPRRSSNGSGTGPERPDANPIARPPRLIGALPGCEHGSSSLHGFKPSTTPKTIHLTPPESPRPPRRRARS